MGVIRKVKESDYDFIYNSLEEYKVALCYGYTKYIMKPIMENKYSLTLVYEEDGKPLAYIIIITHPKSFMDSFYKQMPFYKRFLYLVKQQTNSKEKNKIENSEQYINNIPETQRYMIENLYSIDHDFFITLFVYSESRKKILKYMVYYVYKILNEKQYNWHVGMIRKNNKIALFSNFQLFKELLKIYDVDEEVVFTSINVQEYMEKNKDFKELYKLEL